MTLIYIASPEGQQTTYEEAQARLLWSQGSIARNSLYWREGMPEWRPAVEFFEASAVPAYPSTPPPAVQMQPRGFVKDPTGLTKTLIGLLWAYLAAAGLAAVVSLVTMLVGVNPNPDELSSMDLVAVFVGLPQMLIMLATGIVFLMWIYRANLNARGLGADDMTFTPGWSVGWYFIPILNLWKPYQAMKQIWQASANPAAWQSQAPPAWLGWWWGLWIVDNMLGNASFRLSLAADSPTDLIASEVVNLISQCWSIPLCLVAMKLVRSIFQAQYHWATQEVEPRCAICHAALPLSDMVLLNGKWVCARCKPQFVQQMLEGVQ